MDRQALTSLITSGVPALVVGLGIWRGSRSRRLRIEKLRIRPAIICALPGLSMIGQPPRGTKAEPMRPMF